MASIKNFFLLYRAKHPVLEGIFSIQCSGFLPTSSRLPDAGNGISSGRKNRQFLHNEVPRYLIKSRSVQQDLSETFTYIWHYETELNHELTKQRLFSQYRNTVGECTIHKRHRLSYLYKSCPAFILLDCVGDNPVDKGGDARVNAGKSFLCALVSE